MKKVNIMLSAIAVFALVGGALAFNAKPLTTTTLFSFNEDTDACDIQVVARTKSTGVNTISASIVNGGTCTTYTLTNNEN